MSGKTIPSTIAVSLTCSTNKREAKRLLPSNRKEIVRDAPLSRPVDRLPKLRQRDA
jgi:hypothetical protein